jgi:hypothetical protein
MSIAIRASIILLFSLLQLLQAAIGGFVSQVVSRRSTARRNRPRGGWALGNDAGTEADDDPAVAGDSTTTTSATAVAGRRRRSWDESLALLKSYGEANGHHNVPQSDRPLGTWVNRQRIEHARYMHNEGMSMMRRNNPGEERSTTTTTVKGNGRDGGKTILRRRRTSMTARRKELLDEVGFVWDAMGHSWNAHYVEL